MHKKHYLGKWTNDATDLILEVLAVRYIYPSGVVKVKYIIYNKRNGIVYEKKNGKLSPEFFKTNNKASIYV